MPLTCPLYDIVSVADAGTVGFMRTTEHVKVYLNKLLCLLWWVASKKTKKRLQRVSRLL